MRRAFPLSEQLYQALLHLYPAAFRAAYGRQMRLTFRDACRAAYRRNGMGGLLALWLPTLLDLIKSALEERARQGEITMSKAKLIALAGPLTVLVGSLWLWLSLSDIAIQSGWIRDEAYLGYITAPFFFSFIPLLFAQIGTRLRFHQAAGLTGRLGLALNVAGTAAVLVCMLSYLLLAQFASDPFESPVLTLLGLSGVHAILIGNFLFGIDALKNKLLPRGNILPLLAGSTAILSITVDWFGWTSPFAMEWVSPFLQFAVTGACWMLLGVVLWDPKRAPRLTAAN